MVKISLRGKFIYAKVEASLMQDWNLYLVHYYFTSRTLFYITKDHSNSLYQGKFIMKVAKRFSHSSYIPMIFNVNNSPDMTWSYNLAL